MRPPRAPSPAVPAALLALLLGGCALPRPWARRAAPTPAPEPARQTAAAFTAPRPSRTEEGPSRRLLLRLLPWLNAREGSGTEAPPPDPAAAERRAAFRATEPGRFAHLLAGRSPHPRRRQALRELAEDPPAAAEGALVRVLHTPADPLSGLAVAPLARLESPRARAALAAGAADPRRTVHTPALLAFLAVGEAAAARELAERRLRNPLSASQQAAAVLGLGELGDAETAARLRPLLREAAPEVRLAAAWALWRLGEPSGREWLQRLVTFDDPTYSAQAVRLLTAMREPASVDVLLAALGARHETVWRPAFLGLQAFATERVLAAIHRRAREKQVGNAAEARRTALLRLALRPAGAPLPPAAAAAAHRWLLRSAREGTPAEVRVMAAVLADRAERTGLDALLRALENAALPPAAHEAVGTALRRLAEAADLPGAPAGSAAAPWRRWWLEAAAAGRVRDRESAEMLPVLRSPAGLSYYAAPGVEVVPGVRVERVAGTGPDLRLTVRHQGRIHHLGPPAP
jgi:HEAT repeat protein